MYLLFFFLRIRWLPLAIVKSSDIFPKVLDICNQLVRVLRWWKEGEIWCLNLQYLLLEGRGYNLGYVRAVLPCAVVVASFDSTTCCFICTVCCRLLSLLSLSFFICLRFSVTVVDANWVDVICSVVHLFFIFSNLNSLTGVCIPVDNHLSVINSILRSV